MSKNTLLVRKGTLGAPEGSENWETLNTPPQSTILIDSQGKGRGSSLYRCRTVFELLAAAAAAAGSDAYLLSLGTGTEVIARATKGGINVKTQASTPADNDNAMLKPVASSMMLGPISAQSQLRFSCRVNLTQITELQFSAGLDENLTAVDPTATAGDGAKFCFDPAQEITTGLTLAQHANWVLSQKKAGADTFIATAVPVIAAQDYELEIQFQPDLTPVYYINGVNVGQGVANTSAAVVGVMIGVQINAGSPAGQKDFDIRYAALERLIG